MPEHGNINSLGLYLGPEYKNENGEMKLRRCNKIKSAVMYAARTLEPIRLSKTDSEQRFSDEVGDEVSNKFKLHTI